MTPTQLEAARLAVADKRWRWMPGMLVFGGGRITEHTLAVVHGVVPDLTDPATLGCLLALVREWWRCRDAFCTRPFGDGDDGYAPWWMVKVGVHIVGRGPTEGEALIAAFLAAPGVVS